MITLHTICSGYLPSFCRIQYYHDSLSLNGANDRIGNAKFKKYTQTLLSPKAAVATLGHFDSGIQELKQRFLKKGPSLENREYLAFRSGSSGTTCPADKKGANLNYPSGKN